MEVAKGTLESPPGAPIGCAIHAQEARVIQKLCPAMGPVVNSLVGERGLMRRKSSERSPWSLLRHRHAGNLFSHHGCSLAASHRFSALSNNSFLMDL